MLRLRRSLTSELSTAGSVPRLGSTIYARDKVLPLFGFWSRWNSVALLTIPYAPPTGPICRFPRSGRPALAEKAQEVSREPTPVEARALSITSRLDPAAPGLIGGLRPRGSVPLPCTCSEIHPSRARRRRLDRARHGTKEGERNGAGERRRPVISEECRPNRKGQRARTETKGPAFAAREWRAPRGSKQPGTD